MRIYRGLSKPYRAEAVGTGQGPVFGTDFTDCPLTALSFARGSRGVVIVLDIHASGAPRVSEELWSLSGSGPRRLMVWGRFDAHIAAIIPAKELRARIRVRGIAGSSNEWKAIILREFIDAWIDGTANAFNGSPGPPR